MKLRISDDLTLPLNAVTQTVAILAKRRAGKSYTMRRLVEQLFKAGQQIVIVDPKGDQWGVRSAADGKGPGLPIVILGGERGDVPLEPSGGEVVAKLVVEERVSILLDISLFRKHEVATFMTAFLENLYRLKAREIYRTPMMLVIDEADAIAPQKPQRGEERMLGAAEDIVRRGGQRGIGCVLVTQRSAVLNKNVLTQAQMLVALRTIAPQDLNAMQAWIDVHGTPEQRKTLMESLPSLPIGDAWFWSPGWPTTDGIFQRVHVLPIETFDSGATPAPGQKRTEPKHAADVDLDALKRQMAATIEKAKADDPKELRKQLAALKKQLAQRPKEQVTETKIEYRDVPVLKNGQLDKALKLRDSLQEILVQLVEAIAKVPNAKPSPTAPSRPTQPVQTRQPAVKPLPHAVPLTDLGEVGALTPSEQAVIDAAGAFPNGATRSRLAIYSGRSIKSSSFQQCFSAGQGLPAKGLLQSIGDRFVLTEAGQALARETPAATLDDWMRKLLPSEVKVLRAITDAYPERLTREQVADRTGQSILSSSFQGAFPALRDLELIEGRDDFAANAALMENHRPRDN